MHIPRPLLTAALVGIVGAGIYFDVHEKLPNFYQADPVGGSEMPKQLAAKASEDDGRKARQERAVLERKEEILRRQLEVLEAERARHGRNIDKELEEEINKATDRLVNLLQDKHAAELHIREALLQLWDAEARGLRAGSGPGPRMDLVWPINPVYGISAHYMDTEYEDIFGREHPAIDIPIEQGSQIFAAAPGVVERVVDNGMGYSYIILRHGGVATLYGHISRFLVSEGQEVDVGMAIAESGGRPGSPGAGRLSTGPHLHFEVFYQGEHQNPLDFLPPHELVHAG